MPSASSRRPTSIARAGEKPLLASASSDTSGPSARRIVVTISSVRPGHSSTSWPHSAPMRNLKASNPKRSLSRRNRVASSRGVMSRFMDEAYALSVPGLPPSSVTTGFPSTLPRRSQSAVSRPPMARLRYEPGNLCSFSSIRSSRGPTGKASAPSAQGATWRCRISAVMSELYVDSWPQPWDPSSAVTRTKPMWRVEKLSRRLIRMAAPYGKTTTLRNASPRFTEAMPSLIRSSG